MIYFVVKKQENMEISIDRPISLNQAIDLLNKKNEQAKEQNILMSCWYQLIYDNNLIYESSLLFYDENFRLYDHIEQEILALNQGILTEESAEFLTFLKPLFSIESDKTKKNEQKLAKKEKEANKEVKKETKEKSKKGSLSKKVKRVKRFSLLMLSFLVIFLGVQQLRKGQNAAKTTYEELIHAENYLKAGKQYPEKINDIETILYEQAVTEKSSKTLNKLEIFNTNFETVIGTFDIAILEADYQTAIETYETNKEVFKNNKDRLTLAGYSYLKENQLEKAKEISERLSSVELEKKIFEYTQLSLEIEERDKQLKELEEGGSKNKEKAREIAEDKFQLMEKRVNL